MHHLSFLLPLTIFSEEISFAGGVEYVLILSSCSFLLNVLFFFFFFVGVHTHGHACEGDGESTYLCMNIKIQSYAYALVM